DRLQRNLSTIYEHGLKVLETVDLATRYLDEMFDAEVSDDHVRREAAAFHRRRSALPATFPQFADIRVIDASGHPLVSSGRLPVQQRDLSDRDYFRIHKDNAVAGLYVGDVMTPGEPTPRGKRVFVLSRRRTAKDGRFAGVIVIS